MTPVTRRIVLAATMAAGLSSKSAVAMGKPDFQYLDAHLRTLVSAGYFPGMSLRVGRGDRLLHEAHFGDGAPDRVLHVASAGKWVAAATIAALVDEGRLKWEDRARDLLPELIDIKGDARLSALLSHTAGYPDYQPPEARRDDYQTLEEAVRHIVPLPAVAAPGQVFQYGGLAMQVAGRMAELAARQPFNEIFLTRVARPLGMTRSGFSPVSAEPGFSPMLGGAFFTTVDDYGRFLAMLSQDGMFLGTRVLGGGSVRVMHDDHVGKARVLKDDFVAPARAVRRADIYGLGVWREEVDDRGQATLLSSPGWAGAYGWLDKRMDVWGVVLAKADVPVAVASGYSTFLGSSLYAPMVRTAIRESA
ncbi:CubicO group peptidase (beta-lactamase class C family) [Asticcacaulis solisilvae]|nr:serine hydrolase domain-containing protein [Asticcacaulis solisilvae]MBP2161305.1 CubicO group peptidase (beta-lactamase class C family) [Asticcacaulis solisilvae]MDR6802329.1 CubicO group peptidase (beta-lactamase class C family) [Asticcacaulis sp. BE141]